MIRPWNAIRIHEPFIYSHLNKVRHFRIVLLAEGNNLAHRNIIPVGEWTNYMRNFANFDWLKVWVYICHVIYYISVVLPEIRIFNL